ncbi:MAG: HEPN domain-containing protein [Bacteroidales bacterium]|jgi:uncharacterized protein (UPF0332 family)|nr:HEPN domain-containing protein [Bacteroidales bacterium]MBR2771142.1 HEPN domain-containing protein [Bacteroidales bacterium]MBR4647613.1 HEPN domain-containing protein [Bacteroidales bacterium]
MSLSEEERVAVVSYRIEKAQNAIDEAEKVSAIGLWNIAANRLYYALFYASTAILIKKGLAAHTHAGVIAMISLHLVQQGLLSTEDIRLIRKLFSLRQEGDYEDFVEVTEEEIQRYLPMVKILLDKMIGICNTL